MAAFNSAVTTDQGLALVADMIAGEQLVFTKLVTGSGVYDETEQERTSLQEVTMLKEQRQEFAFSDVSKVTDTCVLLKTLISNVDLTEGYRMTEIGVYAKKSGEEGDGILYSISVAREADYIPHYNGFVAVEIIEEYYITVSDTAEVSIQLGSGASVLIEDFEKFKIEIRNYIDLKIREAVGDVQEQIGDLSELMTENKCCLVDAINEIADVIRPLIEYSYATNQDIDDIIAGIYTGDVDWVTMIDIATERDINAIIDGTYEYDDGDDDTVISDADIDAIIAGTYVEDPEDIDGAGIGGVTDQEIDQIIENAF